MPSAALEQAVVDAAPARPRAGTYRITPERCVATFHARQGLATVHGTLRAVSGQVVVDRRDVLASWVRLDLDAASVDTGSTERDAALRSPHVLDADAHPIVRFESTRMREAGLWHYIVLGDLYVGGRRTPVDAHVRVVSIGRRRLRLAAEADVRRSDLTIGWGSVAEATGLIGNRIHIDVATEVIA